MEEEQKFKDFLMGIGDSIVVVADEDIIKVHVHTNHPGKAIEKGPHIWRTYEYEDR